MSSIKYMFNQILIFMKTKSLFSTAVLGGLMLVSTVLATESSKPGKVLKADDFLRNQIVNALSDVSAVNQEVVIKFAVSEKKGFELLKVEGIDAEVVDVVRAELVSEKIETPAELKGVYTIKVRFADSETVAYKPDAATVLRNQIADVLSSVNVAESTSVKVAFSVEDKNLKIKKIEGENKSLVSDVEKILSNSSIVPPAELAGNYQVTVKF